MIKKLSKLSTHLRVIREINRLLRESDLERLLDSICQILKRERKYIDVFTGILETGEQVSFIDNFKQKNIFSIHCIKKAIESERQLIVEDKRLNCKGCDFRTLNHFAAIFTFETSAGRMFLCVISKHRLDEEEIELLNEVTELMKISVDKIKTEEALRKSEEKYRLLAENVRDVIWTSDLNLNFTYLTPSIERVFGYTAEEFKKLNPEDYLTPESLEIVKNVLSEALSSDKIRKKPSASKILELEAYRKDGSKFYIELNASLLRDSNGKPYGIIGITRDITERKNIEKALKESEKTLRGILKASPVGIGIAEKRVFRFVNKKFCEMVGYSPEELIGKNSRILYETDEKYERVGKIKYLQIKEKGFGIIETRFRRKDGKIIDVLLSSSAIDPSDLSRGIIFTAMDISERKRARKKLEESEKKYRAIFENTGTAMAIIEEDTTISTVNSEFEKLSGYKKEEIEGKMSWTQLVHPEDLEWMRSYHYARREGKEAPKKYEFRFIDREGDAKNIFITIDMIPGTKKSVASLMDITPFKKLNKLLKVLSEINELVVREKNPEVVLKAVCEKLNYIYDGAFTSLVENSRLIPVFSKGIDIKSIKNSLKSCPSILTALKGGVGRMDTDGALCRNCTSKKHRYVLSVPLIYGKNYGVITVHSNLEFNDEEVELLEKMSLNIAFALNAYGIEEDKRKAMGQLVRNLQQFDRTADRLRNPLAVIISSIELMNEIGKDRVLEIVKEQAFRIKDELDELRKEEIKTHRLIEKSFTQVYT